MSLPNYFNKQPSIKSKANKREEVVHKHLVSGALSWKGDFSDKNSVIDHKGTDFKSIKVSEKMLDKIVDDSLSMGKEHSVILLDLPQYYVIGKIVKKASI